MVAPFIPWLIGAAGTAGAHVATKAMDKAEEARKFDAVKHVLGVTPDQAAQIDALKEKSAAEAEAHVALGIDFRNPLPEQAAQRAHEVRATIEEARRTGVPPAELIAKKAAKLTPEEEAAIMSAPPAERDRVIDMVAEKKASEAVAMAQAQDTEMQQWERQQLIMQAASGAAFRG